MRTNWESPMVFIANRFGMTQIMGPEVEINKIGKSIIKTDKTINNIIDTEIGERVLFLLK
jgi:hypothetical protein